MSLAATWMDLEIILLSEVSQRQTNIIWSHMWNLIFKNGTNELIYKTTRLTDIENKFMVTKGET